MVSPNTVVRWYLDVLHRGPFIDQLPFENLLDDSEEERVALLERINQLKIDILNAPWVIPMQGRTLHVDNSDIGWSQNDNKGLICYELGYILLIAAYVNRV